MDRQTAIIAGGSAGLGREISELMVKRGADVIILARDITRLKGVRSELWAQRVRDQQSIQVQSVDLTEPAEVEAFAKSLRVAPSHVFCVAGGCAEEVGLFADISPQQMLSCFQKNYLTSALLAHAILRMWIHQPKGKDPRHLIFTASTAALVALPGYSAYTPTKTALRALADTLRQEVLIYDSVVDIRIHCSFPGTILTEAFTREQERKPEICKQLEGSDNIENATTPKAAAHAIVSGVDHDRYMITMDMQTKLLLNNMRGPSPPETYVWDWLLGLIASVVWPLYRRMFDRETRNYGREKWRGLNGVGLMDRGTGN